MNVSTGDLARVKRDPDYPENVGAIVTVGAFQPYRQNGVLIDAWTCATHGRTVRAQIAFFDTITGAEVGYGGDVNTTTPTIPDDQLQRIAGPSLAVEADVNEPIAEPA